MSKIQKMKFFKNIKYLKGAELSDKTGFPIIAPTDFIPKNTISFNEWRASGYGVVEGVDHFIDDRLFSCVYSDPNRYIKKYRAVKGIIGTDFSAYRDMPKWERIYNVGRNRTMDYLFQTNGVMVVPVVSFAYESDFNWCMDGLPMNSSLAISTNGSIMNFVSRSMFIDGVEILERSLRPSRLIIVGTRVEELDKKYDNIIYLPNYSQRRKMEGR